MPIKIPVCRTELSLTLPLANGRTVTTILRDSVSPDDPYINLARARALEVRTGEPFNAQRVERSVKDVLIKTNITI